MISASAPVHTVISVLLLSASVCPGIYFVCLILQSLISVMKIYVGYEESMLKITNMDSTPHGQGMLWSHVP
jgi:hypothetical protein